MISRRRFLVSGSVAVGGAALAAKQVEAQPIPAAPAPAPPPAPSPAETPARVRRGGFVPVVTPNGATLEWTQRGATKVFHLIAETVDHEFAPGLRAECWGYNGRTPGPTIEVVQGDHVRIYVTNRLDEATTVHWHGVILPNGMDGVSGLTQRAIRPGETYRYDFTFRHPGTFMYHPHFDEMTQMAMGMMGMIVVHPRSPRARVERDFVLMTSEWAITPGTSRPNPSAMSDFNVLTFNGKAFPGTAPLVVRTGDRVRIRLGNLSAMDHHPIHLHGYSFQITATDGGPIAESARAPETTVLVPVGSTRDIEFVADAPGDWAMHCHMTHHVMTQMGHASPSVLGVRGTRALDRRVQRLLPGYMTMGQSGMGGMGDMGMPVPPNSIPMRGTRGPFDPIDMGGMFTVLKVRDEIREGEDPGWYAHPTGTVAVAATPEELAADGIEPPSGPR